MKFALIHYTKGWEIGPEITLGSIPTVGSLIWLSSSAEDESEFDTYYVDNLMRVEKEKEDDEEHIMLFVRPYTKYGETPPLSENDHIRISISDLKKSVDKIDTRLERLENAMIDIKSKVSNANFALSNIEDNLTESSSSEQSEEQLISTVQDLLSEISNIRSNIDSIESKQQSQLYLLDDIKGRM